MSLPWSACIQTFSETKNTHNPLIQRPSQDGVRGSEFRTSLTRSSMIGRTWQVFYMVTRSNVTSFIGCRLGQRDPGRYCRYMGDILVCIFCLDPQMACFLPINAGVCRSKLRWIHQTVQDKLCSSLSALTYKQQLTTLYSKRMQKAYLSFGERKWMEMGEPVLQCGSMYSIHGTFYVTLDPSYKKTTKKLQNSQEMTSI